MASLEDALHDAHFVERGLFAHKVAGPSGKTMAALPMPIAPTLRGVPETRRSPKLGADTEALLGAMPGKVDAGFPSGVATQQES